jgi:rare lipoprotein A (peptidoglycan hydrolase)
MWAVFMGLFAMLAAAASAQGASSGGVSQDVPPVPGECPAFEFGNRPLKLGDCGTDVQTLNWLLKSKPVGTGIIPEPQFSDPTEQAVKAFQSEAGLNADGVVESTTRKALKKSMSKPTASWYGPGFYGKETACGETLTTQTVGVAHRTLPCGTKVVFFANGNWATAQGIDRGPFVKGVSWDLTGALAEQLEVTYTEKVRAAVVAG